MAVALGPVFAASLFGGLAVVAPGVAAVALAGAVGLGIAAMAKSEVNKALFQRGRGHPRGRPYGNRYEDRRYRRRIRDRIRDRDDRRRGTGSRRRRDRRRRRLLEKLDRLDDRDGVRRAYSDPSQTIVDPNSAATDERDKRSASKQEKSYNTNRHSKRLKEKRSKKYADRGKTYAYEIPKDSYAQQTIDGILRDNNSEELQIARLLELIRAEDVTGCGLRLVCELAGLDNDELTEQGLAILDLIGPSIKPGRGVMPKIALEEYRLSRGMGEMGAECGDFFYLCPLNGTQLMASIAQFMPT